MDTYLLSFGSLFGGGFAFRVGMPGRAPQVSVVRVGDLGRVMVSVELSARFRRIFTL